MVGQPVEQRTGEAFGAKDGCPFVEGKIAGHQRGAAFVALAEDLKEQLSAHRRKGHIAQFVDDQQLDGVEMFLQRAQSTLIPRLHEFMHKRRGSREGDVISLLASGKSQGQRDMRLAGSRWT